jgi:hypothetical protein
MLRGAFWTALALSWRRQDKAAPLEEPCRCLRLDARAPLLLQPPATSHPLLLCQTVTVGLCRSTLQLDQLSAHSKITIPITSNTRILMPMTGDLATWKQCRVPFVAVKRATCSTLALLVTPHPRLLAPLLMRDRTEQSPLDQLLQLICVPVVMRCAPSRQRVLSLIATLPDPEESLVVVLGISRLPVRITER